MKSNKYWFGRQFFRRTGFFMPASWEGWLVTIIEIAYLLSLYAFKEFYFDVWGLPFAVSAALFVGGYYLLGDKKQYPKEKGKIWPK